MNHVQHQATHTGSASRREQPSSPTTREGTGGSSVVRRAIGVLTALLVGAAVLQLAAPTPAGAAEFNSIIVKDGGYRSCVDLDLAGCASRGSLPSGTKVKMHCYATGTWQVGVYGSDRYFWVSTAGGTRGFVHSSRVEQQTTVGKCSEHSGVAPARWAAEHIGRTKPTDAEKRGVSFTYWSGYCLLFAQDAFIFTNGSPRTGLGTALAAFRYYRDTKGVARTNLDPDTIAIGAMVFWGTSVGSSGHVGIYLGNGDVVSTAGNEGESKPISMRGLGGAIGWVHPNDV